MLPRALGPAGAPTGIVVHEAAHLLHELTWGDLRLEPAEAVILDVPRRHRETWAHACELWAGAPGRPIVDPRVDAALLRSVLARAAAAPARGWAVLREELCQV